MRFCMVTTFYPPYHSGGCATYVRALSRALVAQGHQVEVIHCIDAYRLRHKIEPAAEATDEGIRVHRLESRFGFLSPLISQQTGHPGLKSSAERAILAQPFDVVNFHNISLIGGPAILAWSRAPVTFYTLHEHWLLCPTHFFWKNRSRPCDRPTCFRCCIASGIPPQLWRYTSLVERAVANVDLLLAPSEYTATRHREAGLPRIRVLPLFSAIRPPAESVPRRGDRPRFLFVGRLVAAKGIVPLLEEFALLPSYDLHVVGDGELRGELERRFAAYQNIRFLGHVPQSELVPAYQDATALIFPSLVPETFGLTIVEAFACGTPAIVHDVGGSRELVDDTGAGFVYRNRDELRAALSQLALDKDLRERLGHRARKSFLRLYTPQQHLKNYLEHVNAVRDAKGLR
jgi:glycosyltransferase involved in cell wall biosynthesis